MSDSKNDIAWKVVMAYVLSVKNPWVYHIFNSGKDVENRTWVLPDKYLNKWIFIHCSQGEDTKARTLHFPNKELAISKSYLQFDTKARGCIVGAVKFSEITTMYDSPWSERDCKNWVISDKKKFFEQDFIPAKGKLNIWEFDLTEYNHRLHTYF